MVALVLLAFIASLIFVRAMISLAPRLGLIDEPDERRIHLTPIPRAGGLAVWGSFCLIALLGIKLNSFDLGALDNEWLRGFFLGSTLLAVVGFVDDRSGMRASVKLVFQTLAAVAMFFFRGDNVGSLLGFQVPVWLDLLVWVGWTVALINAFNLIDGMDGLCGGLALIASLSLAGVCFATGTSSDGWLICIMAACILGFLRYNFHPARIFLGDTGSMILGLFIASASSVSVGERAGLVTLMVPLLVAGIPLFDVVLAVWRRTARRYLGETRDGERVKIFGADKDHLHHRLLALGLSQRKVVTIFYGMAFAISFIVLIPSLVDSRGFGLTFGALGICLMLGLRYVAPVELRASGSALHVALKRPARSRLVLLTYFIFDIFAILLGFTVALIVANKGKFLWLSDPKTLPLFAITLACSLVALRIARAHSTLWGRAFSRDFIGLALWFGAGLQIAFTLVTFIQRDIAWGMAEIFLMGGPISFVLMMLPRTLHLGVRETMIDAQHRRMGRSRGIRKRVVLYGAGDMGELFLSHLRTSGPNHLEDIRIIGFIDDHPHLRRRVLNGFRVLSNVSGLGELQRRYNIAGVIVTSARFDGEQRAELIGKAEELDLTVYHWSPKVDDLDTLFEPRLESKNK